MLCHALCSLVHWLCLIFSSSFQFLNYSKLRWVRGVLVLVSECLHCVRHHFYFHLHFHFDTEKLPLWRWSTVWAIYKVERWKGVVREGCVIEFLLPMVIEFHSSYYGWNAPYSESCTLNSGSENNYSNWCFGCIRHSHQVLRVWHFDTACAYVWTVWQIFTNFWMLCPLRTSQCCTS